jgi:hypothetical protein
MYRKGSMNIKYNAKGKESISSDDATIAARGGSGRREVVIARTFGD